MKRILLLFLLPCLSSCAAMQSTPWDWLDNEEQQRWVDVTFVGYGTSISYSIPDRLKGGGQHTLSSHSLGKDETALVFQVPPESSNKTTELAVYNWDSWWGGFFKESGVDFWLDIEVHYQADESGLLEMSPEEIIQWKLEELREFFSNPLMKSDEPARFFFDNLQLKTYTTPSAVTFVSENNPTLQGDYVIYMTPVSNKQMLQFGFFVNEKRYNWKDDPEWNQRRWDMVHKILDTVRITPAPQTP